MAKRLLALAIMCATVLACSCTVYEDSRGTRPLSEIKGFYAHDQAYYGGSRIDLINIKRLYVNESGDGVEISFSFVQGSASEDMVESDISGVPEFSVRVLPEPFRLVVSLSGISFYDYEMPEAGSGLVPEMFVERLNGGAEAMFVFHLDGSVAYRVKEESGTLNLTLRRTADAASGAWHIVYNAANEFLERPDISEIGLWPSLCADGINRVLLSPPFETEEQAEAFLKEQEAAIAEKLPNRAPYAVFLKAGALPEYNSENDYTEAQDRKVILQGDLELSLPVLRMGAQLLCFSRDGKAAAYSVTAQAGSRMEDRLFIQRDGGELEPLVSEPFMEILDADFSPDGKYLALREQVDDMSPLHVIDLDTGGVYSAAEEGLGITTWGYAWDEDSSALYAMAGESVPEAGTVTFQLKSYSLSDTGNRRVSALEEYPGTDSEVGFAEGYVYFADPYSDSIKRIRKEGGAREQVATGQVFRISPDGRKLAALGGISREDSSTFLDIYDVETGAAIRVVESEMLLSAMFSLTGRYLIYTFDTGENSEYPVAVHAYSMSDGTDRHLFNMRYTASLKRGRDDGEIAVVSSYLSGQEYIPVNYIFTIN